MTKKNISSDNPILPCAFFNDTTSQLNWGCHATSFFTKKALYDNGFRIMVNLTLHESMHDVNIAHFLTKVDALNIKHVFINGEGSLYEQDDLKGLQMIKVINSLKNKSGVNTLLINSGFDLYREESLNTFRECLTNNHNLRVQLREPLSLQNFSNHFEHKAILQPDFLFSVDSSFYREREKILENWNLKERDFIVIGGNSNYYRNDRPAYDAINSYRDFILRIKSASRKKILIYAASEEEIWWLNRIATACDCEFISVDKVSWQDALIILGSAYISISGRYHPTLMSLAQGVPSMMFSANHCKMNGINQMFDLPDAVIDSHKIHLNYDAISNYVIALDDPLTYNTYHKHIKNKVLELKKLLKIESPVN